MLFGVDFKLSAIWTALAGPAFNFSSIRWLNSLLIHLALLCRPPSDLRPRPLVSEQHRGQNQSQWYIAKEEDHEEVGTEHHGKEGSCNEDTYPKPARYLCQRPPARIHLFPPRHCPDS